MSIRETIEFLQDVRDAPTSSRVTMRERMDAAGKLLDLERDQDGVPLAPLDVRALTDAELEAELQAFGDGGEHGRVERDAAIALAVQQATTPLRQRIAELERRLRQHGETPDQHEPDPDARDYHAELADEAERQRLAALPAPGTPPPGILPERGWQRTGYGGLS